jgi:hypothetical protein
LECRGFGLVKTIALTKIDYNARPGVSTANLTGDEHEGFGFHVFFNAETRRRGEVHSVNFTGSNSIMKPFLLRTAQSSLTLEKLGFRSISRTSFSNSGEHLGPSVTLTMASAGKGRK